MKQRHVRFILAAIFTSLALPAVCLAASACVTCHTDSDMLEETVSKVKAKKSPKQAGVG